MKRLFILLFCFALSACVVPNDPTHLAGRQVADAIGATLAKPQPGQDGLVTVSDGVSFVQCRQSDKLGAWRCEAAGTTMLPGLTPVLTPDRVAQLGALGFKPDAVFGNYVLETAPVSDPAPLATAIVQAMIQGYGASAATLGVDARYIATADCPPRRSFGQPEAGAIDITPSASSIAACSAMAALVGDEAGTRTVKIPGPNKGPTDVIAAYTPTITKEMARLRKGHGKHIWITLKGARGYVRCQPDTREPAFYCEASAEGASAGKSGLLHMAGFTQASGNYSHAFPYKQVSDVQMAHLLVTILRDVYGFDGSALMDASDEMGDVTLMPASYRLK